MQPVKTESELAALNLLKVDEITAAGEKGERQAAIQLQQLKKHYLGTDPCCAVSHDTSTFTKEMVVLWMMPEKRLGVGAFPV